MNWGWKIVVVYSAFVIMTLSMVFFFMNQKVDLVADDYYKQEIEYQGQINKISNANSLEEPIGFNYSPENRVVIFTFPVDHVSGGLKGQIHFYRPANADEDKIFNINPDANGEQKIGVGSLSKGMWKVKISWAFGKKHFYNEKIVTL